VEASGNSSGGVRWGQLYIHQNPIKVHNELTTYVRFLQENVGGPNKCQFYEATWQCVNCLADSVSSVLLEVDECQC